MQETLPVTVDKSHLVTIGERLYGESIELIRELVNNAYDADASVVKITITNDEIVVEDDGSGMDLDGLKQYFNIGSTEKRIHRKSPRFGRDRIGEFGIGKFATLSISPYFEVWTKKKDFQGRVVFDKDEWDRTPGSWHLPLFIEEPEEARYDGTKVTLKRLRKVFDIQEVEKRLVETVPIKAPDFSVYLNGKKIRPRYIPGHRIPFLEGTDYGIVHGEIVITTESRVDMREAGIECKVRQVTIKRDFFGMENWPYDIKRISGEVNCDFVPITSDRTDFIKDLPEYTAFRRVMDIVLERVKITLQRLTDTKENRKTKRALSEVLERVKSALLKNLELCPEGLIPTGDEEKDGQGSGAAVTESKPTEQRQGEKPSSKRKKRPAMKRLSPTAVARRLNMGRLGVSCIIDHYGPNGPECFTEGSIIYINRDHPLFIKEQKNREVYILYMARLLTQEISLMKDPKNPRQAFERQSRLLCDALAG